MWKMKLEFKVDNLQFILCYDCISIPGNKKTINCVFQQFFYAWWNETENKDVFYRCLHPGIPVSSSKALLSMCLADKFPQQCRFPYLLNDPSPWILQAPFNNFAQFLSFCLGELQWSTRVIHTSVTIADITLRPYIGKTVPPIKFGCLFKLLVFAIVSRIDDKGCHWMI